MLKFVVWMLEKFVNIGQAKGFFVKEIVFSIYDFEWNKIFGEKLQFVSIYIKLSRKLYIVNKIFSFRHIFLYWRINL